MPLKVKPTFNDILFAFAPSPSRRPLPARCASNNNVQFLFLSLLSRSIQVEISRISSNRLTIRKSVAGADKVH